MTFSEFTTQFSTEEQCRDWLLGTHQGAVQETHLQAYLNEYVFSFNRRKSADRGLLFYRLLECAMQIPPVTQDELLGHKD